MITQTQHSQTWMRRDGFGSMRPGWRLPAILIFLVFLSGTAGAATPDPARPIRQMRHAVWNEASGISGTIYALTQTTDGFLWVGSTTGLFRFDGLKFEP